MSHLEIASPCIRHCCLDENDVCMGCFRSLPEITGWLGYTQAQRQQVLERINIRKTASKPTQR